MNNSELRSIIAQPASSLEYLNVVMSLYSITWSHLRLNLPTCMQDMTIASIINGLHCQQLINALQSVIQL